MDEDGLPIVGTGIDYTKVNPLDKKRLLAFVNHFVSHTVQFLNHFAGVCEEKMSRIESQLHRMEVTMTILETKLSSIPGLDDIKVTDEPAAQNSASAAHLSQPTSTTQPGAEASSQQALPPAATEEPPPPAVEEAPSNPVSKDSRFMKFFKMLNVGVPAHAVKMKMAAEGVDPDLLDNPDAPAPPAAPHADESSDSDQPFSDSD